MLGIWKKGSMTRSVLMFEGLGSTNLTNKSHIFLNQKPHVFFLNLAGHSRGQFGHE